MAYQCQFRTLINFLLLFTHSLGKVNTKCATLAHALQYRLLLLITTVYSQDSRKLDTFAGFFVCLGLMLYTVTEMLLLLISSLLMVGKLKIVYLINNQQKGSDLYWLFARKVLKNLLQPGIKHIIV